MAEPMVELKLAGFEGVEALLRSLPPEVVSRRGGVVRKVLRKGAKILQLQGAANLRAQTSNQTSDGDSESTGLLLKNWIITRGKYDGKGERVLVRVRKKVYIRKGAPVNTQQNAVRLEYGTGKQPAEPWIRPAFNTKAKETILFVEKDLASEIAKIVAKLKTTAPIRR